MMATTILLVGFIGLMQAITLGSESLDIARKQQVAGQLLNLELERLRGARWTDIAALPSSATIDIDGAGTVTGDTTSFALSNFTVTTADDNAALAGLARGFRCTFASTRLRPAAATPATVTFVRLVYTITWTGNTGRTYTRTAETYLARNGLHLSFQQT